MTRTTTIVCTGLLALAAGAAGGCKKKEAAQGSGSAAGSAAASPREATGSGSAAAGSAEGSAVAAAGSGEGAGSGAGSAAAPADKRVVVKDAFATPESVFYDAAADVYLVANINGNPTEADDNGFISKISPEGKVVELKWIDGSKPDVKLDAPKGIAVSGDTLWVADLTVVRKFDAKTGAPKGEVKIPNAAFLNDVTPAEGGGVYVTDTGIDPKFQPNGRDGLYHIGADDKVKAIVKSKDLGGPNGVAVAGDSAWVNTFVSGEVYEVTLKGDKPEKKAGVKPPKGQLDGMLVRPDGELIVSSWEGQAVYAGKPGGEWRTLIEGVQAPADLGWDSKRNVLLIPQFNDNAVILLPL